MTHYETKYEQKSRSFWEGFFGVFERINECDESLDLQRYPRNTQQLDLERIGQDMFKSVWKYNDQIKTKKSAK